MLDKNVTLLKYIKVQKRTSYDVNIEGETLLALTYSLKTNYQFYTSYTKKTKNMNLAM